MEKIKNIPERSKVFLVGQESEGEWIVNYKEQKSIQLRHSTKFRDEEKKLRLFKDVAPDTKVTVIDRQTEPTYIGI